MKIKQGQPQPKDQGQQRVSHELGSPDWGEHSETEVIVTTKKKNYDTNERTKIPCISEASSSTGRLGRIAIDPVRPTSRLQVQETTDTIMEEEEDNVKRRRLDDLIITPKIMVETK